MDTSTCALCLSPGDSASTATTRNCPSPLDQNCESRACSFLHGSTASSAAEDGLTALQASRPPRGPLIPRPFPNTSSIWMQNLRRHYAYEFQQGILTSRNGRGTATEKATEEQQNPKRKYTHHATVQLERVTHRGNGRGEWGGGGLSKGNLYGKSRYLSNNPSLLLLVSTLCPSCRFGSD